MWGELHILLADERVVKIAEIARQTAILQHWGVLHPPPPPTHTPKARRTREQLAELTTSRGD